MTDSLALTARLLEFKKLNGFGVEFLCVEELCLVVDAEDNTEARNSARRT